MIKIPCTFEGCDHPAVYFELPSKWGIHHACHCKIHARDTKEAKYAWNIDLQMGFATKSKKVYLAELTEILKVSI